MKPIKVRRQIQKANVPALATGGLVLTRECYIERVKQLFDAAFPETDDKPFSCVQWSACAVVVARRFGGFRWMIQAGSASWPRIPREKDDGKINTHFSYIYDPAIDPRPYLKSGIVPELHAWAGYPTTLTVRNDGNVEGQIVDFTTGFLPQVCGEMTGEAWATDVPPPVLWAPTGTLPGGARYGAHRQACELVMGIVQLTVLPRLREALKGMPWR